MTRDLHIVSVEIIETRDLSPTTQHQDIILPE
jgi:hypothetical protein